MQRGGVKVNRVVVRLGAVGDEQDLRVVVVAPGVAVAVDVVGVDCFGLAA
jgi:hypothetical protein